MSYRNAGDRQVIQRRDRFSNPDYNTNNSSRKIDVLEMSLNDYKKRVDGLENKLKTQETDYRSQLAKNQANFEDLKKRIEALEHNQTQVISNSSFLQLFDNEELKILGNVAGKIQNMMCDSQIASSPILKEDITPHCNFVMDEEDRAIVYVRSKMVNTGKDAKAAFGIWWAAGHKGNVERVVTSDNITENSVNLQAIICVMETAIRFKMQRLCVVSDAKYVISKMINRFPQSPSEDSSQWKVFLLQPSDERDLFQYAYEMTTWFYDIKWSYTDSVKKLPGMQDALKLIDNCLSNE